MVLLLKHLTGVLSYFLMRLTLLQIKYYIQSILEGKGVFLKKIIEGFDSPANGFNIIATANTKGKGSDDGRFYWY